MKMGKLQLPVQRLRFSHLKKIHADAWIFFDKRKAPYSFSAKNTSAPNAGSG